MKKRILSLVLALVLLLTMAPAAFAANGSLSNFRKTNTYTSGRFIDVPATSWFTSGVKAAYEYGLVVGVSQNQFGPNNNITIAETITLAARLNAIYYGKTIDLSSQSSRGWFQPYLDYAIANGIIAKGDYSDYTMKANRQQFAFILAAALPESALPKINAVGTNEIPDMKSSNFYAPSIYRLYNAGILAGRDGYGTFAPLTQITRAEVASIVARMADTSLRVRFTLEKMSCYLYLKTYYTGQTIYTDYQESSNLYTRIANSSTADCISLVQDVDVVSENSVIRVQVDIPKTNKTSNKAVYTFYYNGSELYKGTGTVSPAGFVSDKEITFSSYNGTKYGGDKTTDQNLAGSMLSLALMVLNEKVLLPNGYKLSDIGYSSFTY